MSHQTHKLRSIYIYVSQVLCCALLMIAILTPMQAGAVKAPNDPGGGSGSLSPTTSDKCDPNKNLCSDCNGGGDKCVTCANDGCDPAAKLNGNCTKDNCDLVKKYVNPGINLLSIVFGLIAVISLILGGVNFATSEGDPQKAGRAKDRISKTVIAIVAYFFLYAFLQFLIPGGIF